MTGPSIKEALIAHITLSEKILLWKITLQHVPLGHLPFLRGMEGSRVLETEGGLRSEAPPE